jgi:hypothetical protein
MHKTATFRAQTQGLVADFISDEGLTCHASQNLISFLAGELLNYREEGKELSPTLLYGVTPHEVIKAFPGSTSYHIGSAPLHADSAKRILKDCAPLATDNWHIYVERIDSDKLRYGVFSYLALPTSLSLFDTISVARGPFTIVIKKISASTIRILGSQGHTLSLIFSTVREESSDEHLTEKFTTNCCSALTASDERDAFKSYLKRFFERSLSASHGTILICAKPKRFSGVKSLKDGVLVNPPLSLSESFCAYRKSGTADSLLKLQSLEELVQGLMNSDGVVVFDPEGNIIAYRVFYKDSGKSAAPKSQMIGGARRRAFEGIKKMVGNEIVSAFFRSQDGHSEYQGGE